MRATPTIAILLALAPAARAESPGADTAIAVNLPLRWHDAGSIAGSLYLGLADHHALRANVASYEHGGFPPWAEDLLDGRTTDLGIGWVYYPDRAFGGWMLEVGALRRGRDNSRTSGDTTTTLRSSTYAARAMIGWTWLFADHVFLAFGIGGSIGYESGTDTEVKFFPAMNTTMTTSRDIGRRRGQFEGYLRIGVAFGR